MTSRLTLPIIDARVEQRCRDTAKEHPWWPCTKGCDLCCRSLPRLPEISAEEWARIRDAMVRLPGSVLRSIEERIVEAHAIERKAQGSPAGVEEHASRAAAVKLTCPLLDRERGACLVYAARPVACRTYGFYTERDGGLHCTKVTAAIATHAGAAGENALVWGNGEAIATDMRRSFGEVRSLAEWMNVTE